MKELTLFSLLILAAPMALAGGEKAAEAGAMGTMQFSEVDTNGDGMVTMEEAEAAGMVAFQDADANADGQLDEEEFVVAVSGETEEAAASVRETSS